MSRDLLSTLIDRFKGSAMGACVGDAMGREVEGWSRERIREDPAFDPALTARRFLANFHPQRNYGARIYGIMELLRQGDSWDRVGTDSWGNGGAMRIAPIGFFFYEQGELLKENALLCTRITHRHPQAMAGALAQAMAVGMATHKGMTGDAIARPAFLEEIVQGVQGVDGLMATELMKIRELVKGGDLEARIDWIARTFSRDVSALGAVPAAIASFLINEDFPSTVVTAINCGGDTDTIGAMAGALAGAYYGYAAIPAAWCEPLENGAKGRDYVAALAEEMACIKARQRGWV